MFGNKIDTVYGQSRNRLHNYLEVEDIGVAVVSFKNGAVATIEGTTNVYPKNLEETLYVFGEKGTVKLGGTSCNNIDLWDFSEKDDSDEKKASLKEPTSNVYGNGHTSLYQNMIQSIIDNKEPLVNGEEGKSALELVLAIYKSQLTGNVVKLPLDDFSSDDMVGYFDR